MLLKDIVKIDTQGKFISAVQLSDYDRPEDNLSLVKSYIFAESAPNTYGGQLRSVGSIDLLKDLRLAFNNNASNCFVVVANYGHGKSHLALVLANYFAKSAKSPEVKKILERIDQSLNNPAKAEDYHEFKKQNDRFLVIRLSGDTNKNLREQFFPALQKALQEHKETQSIELPFWNQQAKIWLEGKVDDKQAKKFLKDNFSTDIHSLIQEVEEYKSEAYEQYVQLFRHINNNVAPNLDGNFDFKDAVKWAVDVCKKSKALSGVLVLFDEFSQFVQRYSEGKSVGDLQNLLQGIQDHRGKSLFLAFAQHDPEEVADQYAGGQSLQSIKRELNRIEKKYALYSLMEAVLDSYLSQSDSAWTKMLAEQPRIRGSIFRPTELVWELYSERYNRELRWTNDKFRDVVTKGCFPLHPLTTALLGHLKMQESIDDDPRTILRFVRDRFESKQNEIVADSNGKVNRIYPIELVDYFQGRIAKKALYASFENAIKNVELAFTDQLTDLYHSVLKALLLQESDQLNAVGERQIEILSEMTGIDEETTIQLLKELGKKTITRYDENLRVNSFWPVSVDPQALEEEVKKELSNKKFDEDAVYCLNNDLENILPESSRIPVPVEWGAQDDWASKSIIATRETFTIANLQKSLQLHNLSFSGLKDGNRGLVCWLLALDDTDIEYFSKNAAKILHDSFSNDAPPPVVVVLPKSTNKTFTSLYLRYKVLEELKTNRDLVKKVTQTGFENDVDRTRKSLVKALGNLFGDVAHYRSVLRNPLEILVHQKYKANLATLPRITIDSVLRKIYDLAYPYRPPKFFEEFAANPKKGTKTIGDGVKVVSKNLIHNQINSVLSGMSKFSQDRICKQQLLANWHILTTRYYIQEPDITSLKYAWDYLDNSVKADEKDVPVKNIIPVMFNPPYGFDYNTATLLICAWIGKNKTKLSFSTGNKMVGIDYLEKLLESEQPQEFLGKLCTQNFTIARRDIDKSIGEVRKVVDGIQKVIPRSQHDADTHVGLIRNILSQGVLPEDEKDAANEALNALNNAVVVTKNYDDEIKKLIAAFSKEDNLKKLLGLENELRNLKSDDLVIPSQPKVGDVQITLSKKIESAVKETCKELVNLKSIEGADAARASLRDYKESLNRKGYNNLTILFTQAESDLSDRIKYLKSTAVEIFAVEQINAMRSTAQLAILYEYIGKIKQFSNTSESFEKLRNRKLEEINAEILNLEAFAKNIKKTAKEVSPDDLGAFYDSIISHESRYYGSEYESFFLEAKEYTGRLRSYFDDLKSVKSMPVRIPDDETDILARLEKISKSYSSKINKNHKSYLEETKNALEEKIQAEYEKAEKIIKEVDREIKSARPVDLRKKLESIAFINKDIKAKQNALLAKIEEKEAQDVIGHIEDLFKSIRDRKKREECIQRLQEID